MMTFRQWMMQMARQYGRHYVVALFMCCLLFPLLFSGYDIVRDTVIISSGPWPSPSFSFVFSISAMRPSS